MNRKPPPIAWIVVFDAAARHESFKHAASELNITPSAVSQQIKKLEHWLNCSLFHRQNRQLELSVEGKAFHEVALTTLSTYRSAYTAFAHRFEKPMIRLSMVPFVAHELCLPALSLFQREYPDVQLRFETTMQLVDFKSEPVDAAIRLGDGHWPELEVLPLAQAQVTVVAAESLLTNKPIRSVSDLANHTLIYTRGTTDDWSAYARFTKVKAIKGENSLVLDDFLAAMRAVEQGLGIGLGIQPLIRRWLNENRIIAVFEPVNLPWQHYLVFPKDTVKRETILLLYPWLQSVFNNLH